MRRFYYILFCIIIICIGIFLIANKASSAPLANNLAWCTANSGAINISYAECTSLAYLYHETNGDNWNATGNWFSGTDVSLWKGGDGTNSANAMYISGGHVITLSLAENNVWGNIQSGFIGLTYLSGVNLFHNGISNVNTSGLSTLRSFNVGQNGGFSGDFTYTTGLKYLNLYYNNLTTERMNALIAPLHDLVHLFAWNNILSGGVDVSGLTKLRILELNESMLPSIDLSNNNELTHLAINYSNLTYLDLSNNTALQYIVVQDGSLTGINLNAPVATEIYLSNNNIDTIDLSHVTGVVSLGLTNNQLSSIDLSNNTQLGGVHLSNNNLTYLNLSGRASNLGTLNIDGNFLTGIDLSSAPSLMILNISSQQGSGITSLDISNNIDLQEVYASGSNIQTLITAPAGSYGGGTIFDFSNNPLSNVTDPNALTFLSSFNQYTSVNALTGTAHDTAITLEWERPTDFGYSGDLYRYTVSLDTGAVKILTGAATSSYLATGLTNSHTYVVSLCAVYGTTGADVSMCDHLSLTPEESFCDPGRELSTGGAYPMCVPCMAGTFNALINGSCIPGPAGYYIENAGATGAIKCAPGSYSQSGGTISCTWASPGTFVAYEGSTGATLCEPGTYRIGTGAMTCLRTDPGYYASGYGASFQTPCEANTYTDIQHSTSCLPCPTGYISNAGAITCVQISAIGGGGGGGIGLSSLSSILNPTKTIPSLRSITSGKKPGKTTLEVYKWALAQNITTLPLTKARLNDKIQRYEVAKMIVNFIKNIEKKPIAHKTECDVSRFSDANLFDSEMKMYMTSICDLSLMGWRTPKSKGLVPLFRPFDTLSVDEFNIVINRYLNSSTTNIAKSNKRVDIMRFLMEQSAK